MSSASLAILGDYVPFGIGQALGLRARGNSIDNTLRIGQMVRSDWVLLDVPVHQVVNGFGYGDVHLWSESGALPGTASQSTICAGGRTRSDKPDVGSDAVGQNVLVRALLRGAHSPVRGTSGCKTSRQDRKRSDPDAI